MITQLEFNYAIIRINDETVYVTKIEEHDAFNPNVVEFSENVIISIYENYTTVFGKKFHTKLVMNLGNKPTLYNDMKNDYIINERNIIKTKWFGLYHLDESRYYLKRGWYISKESKPFTITATNVIIKH